MNKVYCSKCGSDKVVGKVATKLSYGFAFGSDTPTAWAYRCKEHIE